MNPIEELEVACTNLTQTYLTLGTSTTGSSQFESDDVFGCFGTLDHPVCNFAFTVRPNLGTVALLQEFCRSRSAATIYLLPSADQSSFQSTLQLGGFTMANTLTIMVKNDLDEGPHETQLEEVSGFSNRYAFSTFLAEQFFPAAPTGFIHGLALATAEAASTSLMRYTDRGVSLGGAMLFETEGSLGIYNVAVAGNHRGKGHGKKLMSAVIQRAHSVPKLITLQCQYDLEQFYRSFGFRSIGRVFTFRKN